ncbi:MAG: hypothetical protein ACTSQI_09015 [Candidatus Helarchaeota archaeon]
MNQDLKKDNKPVVKQMKPGSLNAMLEFYKDSFSLEEGRKDTLEDKASMVLGFSGIIAGLITGLFSSQISTDMTGKWLFFICFFGSVLCFTVGGIFALLTVRLKNYMQPFATLTPEQIDALLSEDENLIKNEIVKNYSDALLNNQVLNNQKASKLNTAFYSASLGIALTLLAAVFAFFPIF